MIIKYLICGIPTEEEAMFKTLFRIYLNILLEIQSEQGQLNWNKFPNSLTEFIFYQKAIEKCPDVFKEHPKFDNVINVLNENEELSK